MFIEACFILGKKANSYTCPSRGAGWSGPIMVHPFMRYIASLQRSGLCALTKNDLQDSLL